MVTLMESGYDVCAAIYPPKGIGWSSIQQLMESGVPADKFESANMNCNINFADPQIEVFEYGFMEALDVGAGFLKFHPSPGFIGQFVRMKLFFNHYEQCAGNYRRNAYEKKSI